MEQKIKVLIVDDVEETRELMRTLFSFEPRIEIVGEASDGEEAIELTSKLRPDVVLMDINMPGLNGLKATEIISKKMPDVIVIVVSVQKEREYLKKAMLCGAKEYIVKPLDLNTTVKTIIDTYNLEQERRNYIDSSNPNKLVKKDPEIISVFSTKGGVGKTTIAVNTALSITRQTGEKVAIIDLDLQFGDVAIILDITPTKTIVDLIEEISDLNGEILNEYMLEYIPGLKILSAPIKPEYAEYINSSHIEKIIEVMKTEYQYIIIDTPTNFDEVTLTALDMSDKVLFVTNMDLVSIKNTKVGLEVMNSLNYSEEKVKLVVNKASQKFGIKYKDLEEAFENDIRAFIPDDKKTIITSINKGYPFMRYRKSNKICRSMKELSKKIVSGKY
ncbi:response regulator [Thermohalobacter berrensis]|uniref:Histidine kinase n=1 Tax=Thermohalobacter berrensis TaxID=99594 RepID=A0A419SUB9_9FIRM|nr:response regulator [Thermohalobacter berrensis]RKD28778.1 histidine kinase [Thermohalobacter berrensis]